MAPTNHTVSDYKNYHDPTLSQKTYQQFNGSRPRRILVVFKGKVRILAARHIPALKLKVIERVGNGLGLSFAGTRVGTQQTVQILKALAQSTRGVTRRTALTIGNLDISSQRKLRQIARVGLEAVDVLNAHLIAPGIAHREMHSLTRFGIVTLNTAHLEHALSINWTTHKALRRTGKLNVHSQPVARSHPFAKMKQ